MKSDRIVSVSAMLVAVASLAIVVYQVQLMRASQAAAVLPYLTVAMLDNDDGTFIVVRNDGVGPALLEDVRIRYRGRELRTDPYDFYLAERAAKIDEIAADFEQSGGDGGFTVDKLAPGRLIAAGEWLLTLGWSGDAGEEIRDDMLALFDIAEVPQSWYDQAGVPASGPAKAIIEITYASLYGERWRVASDELAPERID